MTQTKQDRPFRLIALSQQHLGRFHDADQLVFDVQRASAPYETIGYTPFKGRVRPLRQRDRIGGNDILVRHQHNRVQSYIAPGPDIEQAIVIDDLAFQVFVHPWIGLGQQAVQLGEGPGIRGALLIQGHGLAANGGRQVLRHRCLVYCQVRRRLGIALPATEHGRPHDHIERCGRKNGQNDVEYCD